MAWASLCGAWKTGHSLVQGSIIPKPKRDFIPRGTALLCFAPEWSCEAAFMDLFFYVESRYSSLFKPNIHTTCPALSGKQLSAVLLKSGQMLLPELCNLDNGEGNWEDLPSQDSPCTSGRPPVSSADCSLPYNPQGLW